RCADLLFAQRANSRRDRRATRRQIRKQVRFDGGYFRFHGMADSARVRRGVHFSRGTTQACGGGRRVTTGASSDHSPSFFSISFTRAKSFSSRRTQAICCFASASGTAGVAHQAPPLMLLEMPLSAPMAVLSPISLFPMIPALP